METQQRNQEEMGQEGGGGVKGSKVNRAHQCLSREDLQQGDQVVSISEVLVQVGDVSLRLRTQRQRH